MTVNLKMSPPTTVNRDVTLAVLTEARDLFAAHGGAKNFLMDNVGRICVNGAVNWANMRRSGLPDPVTLMDMTAPKTQSRLNCRVFYSAVAELSHEAQQQHGCDHVEFNNRPDTTVADLLPLFDKAVARLEERVA
jgi:hypothetical protein